MAEKVLSARFEKPDSHRLETYEKDGGYQAQVFDITEIIAQAL